MNPKILVGVIVVVLAAAIGVFALSGQTLINDLSDDGFFPSGTQTEIIPLEIEFRDITILDVTDRHAEIQVEFVASNPNQKSILLSFVKYQLYEGDLRVHIGEIGERLDSMIIGSNYFTLLTDQPTVLKDKFTIKNTGNTPEFWDALASDSANWRISGEAIYNLSSMTQGGQNEAFFEFP